MVDNTTVDDSQGNSEAEATTMEATKNNKRNNHKMNIFMLFFMERYLSVKTFKIFHSVCIYITYTPRSNIQNTKYKNN